MQIKSMEESRVECVFRIREWGLAMGNLATALEETHRVQEALENCKRRLQVSLEAGKGNEIGRCLVTVACALEQKKDEKFMMFSKKLFFRKRHKLFGGVGVLYSQANHMADLHIEK